MSLYSFKKEIGKFLRFRGNGVQKFTFIRQLISINQEFLVT